MSNTHDFPAGTKVRNRHTLAVMFVTVEGIWLERFYERLPMSDLDLQLAEYAQTLPHARCSFAPCDHPHTINDPGNGVPTHYCPGGRVCVVCDQPIELTAPGNSTRYVHAAVSFATDHRAQPKLAHPMDSDPFAGIE